MKVIEIRKLTYIEVQIEYEEISKHFDIINDLIKKGCYISRCSSSISTISFCIENNYTNEYIRRMKE